MNKKLIFQLSLIGLVTAFATIFFIPAAIEPYVWLILFIFYAVTIAKKCSGKYFMHGFLLSLLNGVWITAMQVLFFDKYIQDHPDILDAMSNAPMPYSPRIMLIMMGLPIAAVFGVVLGIFCVVAARVIKQKSHKL